MLAQKVGKLLLFWYLIFYRLLKFLLSIYYNICNYIFILVVLLTLSLVTTAVGGEPENKAEKYFNLTMTNVTTTDLQTYHDIALQLHKMEDEIQRLTIKNRYKEAIEEGSQRLGDSKISNVFQDTVILDMNIT